MLNFAYAQLTVTLEPASDTKILRVGATPLRSYSQQMLITARTNRQQCEFIWEINNSVQPDVNLQFLYRPPDNIPERAELVSITVTVTDNNGEKTNDTLKFLLIPWQNDELREELKREIEQKDIRKRIAYLKQVLTKNIEKYEEQRRIVRAKK